MSGPWTGFVVLADMRTGSNLLQETLGLYEGITCLGELFNPSFVGAPGQASALGVSLDERDADPVRLLDAVAALDGIAGFRFFPDHDPRILTRLLDDTRWAKIVLNRNPLASYISLKTARETGQWWLGDISLRRSARPEFDPAEFAAFVARRSAFAGQVRRSLQTSGQVSFHVDYDDLHDSAVIDGMVKFLGADPVRSGRSVSGLVQTPAAAEERISNPEVMRSALEVLDLFSPDLRPDFEPRRGANVPGFMASDDADLMYLPVPGTDMAGPEAWLASLGDTPLRHGFTRKDLRKWKRDRPGHRSFTIVEHPAPRAYRSFCAHILDDGPARFPAIRKRLEDAYGLGPDLVPEDADAVRAAFLGFLAFVKANLAGQTGLRVPAVWASQAEILRGFADVIVPDAVFRENAAHAELPAWAGRGEPWPQGDKAGVWPAFTEIWNDDIATAARRAYQKDFMAFGFGDRP